MTASNRLVTRPSVSLITKPKVDTAGLQEWIFSEGLEQVAANEETPLGRFVKEVERMTANGDSISEFAGRFCYNSWRKGRSKKAYVNNILSSAHGSVLQHVNYGFAITGVSRALTHELVRHHAGASPSQESQRYVDASSVRFVVPPILLELWNNNLECGEAQEFLRQNLEAVVNYIFWQDYITEALQEDGVDVNFKPSTRKKRANEAARSMLPNATETKVFWTVNVRALRNILEQRGGEGADLEIRRLAVELLKVIQSEAPESFLDIDVDTDNKPSDFGVDRLEVRFCKV